MPPTSALRSAGAIVAGLVTTVVLTLITDIVLSRVGVLPSPDHPVRDEMPLVLATLYRFVFGAAGAAVTCRAAPSFPMRHALGLGLVALGLNVLGAVTMWGEAPAWYPLSGIALALPSVWFGGLIATRAAED